MLLIVVLPPCPQALPCVGPAADVPFLLENIQNDLVLETAKDGCIKLSELLSHALDFFVN